MIKSTKNKLNTGAAIEVLLAFFKLGLSAFGGPIAHLGYFRKEFVERRDWITEQQFGQLLAICQCLPGPASSQLGFCIGLLRAGWLGALAAFVGFTLPSALLLIAFAASLPLLSGSVALAAIHGLKLVACAVVADAVLGMSKKLCPDVARQTIAILTATILLVISSTTIQLFVIILAAIAGVLFLRETSLSSGDTQPLHISFGPSLGGSVLLIFIALFIGLPLFVTAEFVTADAKFAAVAEAFYRAGALVFGGGHVVLPLLQDSLVATGWVSTDQFMAGYGASQAIPGPMFAFAAYLGSLLSQGENTWLMATTALCFMFLPGFLLVTGILPFWQSLSHKPYAGGAIAGANAAVVGLLAATLYNPIITTGINNASDFAIVAIGFALLAIWRVSPLLVVAWCIAASVLRLWL